jgi:hypothetical protein
MKKRIRIVWPSLDACLHVALLTGAVVMMAFIVTSPALLSLNP